MTDVSSNKAPWHLWVVGILALLWDGFGAFDFIATVTHFMPYLSQFPPAMLEYIATVPGWMWVVWFASVFAGLAGAVLLLLRRRLAVPAFAISLAGVVISGIDSVVDPPPPDAGANAVLPWIIVAFAVGLFLYSRRLSARGLLH